MLKTKNTGCKNTKNFDTDKKKFQFAEKNVSLQSKILDMYDVKITALRKADYKDLQQLYENPIEHTCDVREGQTWVARGGAKPDGMCDSAWESMRGFVESLARGEGNFYDGWMQNPYSAMISCNDGFRPVSFLLERL